MNDPLGAVEKLGDWMAKSGLFGCEKAEQGRVLAMICMTERKSPTAILRTYHLVGGKLSKKAMAAFAEFRRAGGKVRWIQTGDEPNAKEASAVFTWEGNDTTWSYSLDDATRAGLVRPNSGWVLRPGNMLRSKVISNALGALAPEIFAGEDESDIQDRPRLRSRWTFRSLSPLGSPKTTATLGRLVTLRLSSRTSRLPRPW